MKPARNEYGAMTPEFENAIRPCRTQIVAMVNDLIRQGYDWDAVQAALVDDVSHAVISNRMIHAMNLRKAEREKHRA
jgi:hypothetical protein